MKNGIKAGNMNAKLSKTLEFNSFESQKAANTGGAKKARSIQSLERAFDIIEVLANDGHEMRLSELAKMTGLNISTCHHLLLTLVKRGYVGRNPHGRTYFIGPKVTELSDSRIRQFNILEIAMPQLRKLNKQTGESIHLAVMQGYELTTLVKLDSTRSVRVGTDGAGKANAAHATATGKSILAWYPETEIIKVFAEKGLTRFTENTITGIADLMEEFRLVRRNGIAVDREEFQLGVTCVGVVIRDQTGAVIGSISCSMPSIRAHGKHFDFVEKAIRQTSEILASIMGSPPDSITSNNDII